MLIKRYIQYSQNPIPVSYTFDCQDLVKLFDTKEDYVEHYLCGKEEFWEPSEWFQYEWDDWMLDSLDETNWKTISSIFGGVSQEVAEHILSKQPQNEEEEELIEKYEEEISDIKHFIMWANNDAHEDAVKSAMIDDIDEKLSEHFNSEGKMISDVDKGWKIEGDLRSWINDRWDNPEYTFEFHNDYVGETIEGVMMNELDAQYNKPDILFSILVEEEYMFDEYCEGKQGECLQVDSKFFDGYWTPNYDINEILADRLVELTYQPEPIQEQSGDFPDFTSNKEDDNLDETPFTKLDVSIMNRLAKIFSKDEVREIWEEAEENIKSGIYEKFINFIKLFGENINSREGWAKATRFAKWTDDNWDEAERIKQIELDVTPDTTISDLDFGLVTQPVKEWPSLYTIDGQESYWVKEFRYGEGDFAGYGEDDAVEKANANWYEHDIDMEFGDQGDSDDHDLNVSNPKWLKSLKEARIQGLIFESGMLKEMEFDRYELLKLAKNTKGGVRGGRLEVFKFLENLRESGLVNMFQSVDFLWSGKQWLIKYLDFKHPERLEEPDENIQYLLDNADRMRDVLVVLLMDRADREGKTPELDNMNKEIRPLAQDLVKIWAAQI
jgi:hypothetical protein